MFHHANPSLKQDGKSSPLIASAVGTEGQIFPDDAGKLIKPDATVNFGMHFWPIDKDVEGRHGARPVVLPGRASGRSSRPRVRCSSERTCRPGAATPNKHSREIARRGDLLIPPNGTAMYQGTYVLDKPARIHDLRGHMHVRGKYQIVEAVYPDGRREVINKLNWDHGWHTTFVYEPNVRPLLPKGTVLITTSMFDNTPHKGNPDPDQWVVAGSRTVDEMSHIWIGMTFFDKEEDFQKLVAEREQLRRAGAEGVHPCESCESRLTAISSDGHRPVTPHGPSMSSEIWPQVFCLPGSLSANGTPLRAQHPTDSMECDVLEPAPVGAAGDSDLRRVVSEGRRLLRPVLRVFQSEHEGVAGHPARKPTTSSSRAASTARSRRTSSRCRRPPTCTVATSVRSP